jgi:serine protease Do
MSFSKKLAIFSLMFAALAGTFVAVSGALNPSSIQFKSENEEVERINGINDVVRIQNVFREIARTVMPAVVSINVESEVQTAQLPNGFDQNDPFFRYFFGDQFGNGNGQRNRQSRRVEAQGSGFIISKDGYIFSNNHVVERATKITVVTVDNRKFEAKVVGTDPDTDIAILKIEADSELPFVAIGDSDQVQAGDWVLAIGNPFGLAGSYTFGIVSAVGRPGMASFQSFIQTDVAVNPGNSGGPLVNVHGQVVGINTAIQSQTGGYMGISFAVPINIARSVAVQIVDHGYVSRGFLGIYPSELDNATREHLGLAQTEGVMVSRVDPDTPAEKAGLRRGDIITKVDGQPISDPNEFRLRVGSLAPNTQVKLEVLRDETRIVLTAVLGQRGEGPRQSRGDGEQQQRPQSQNNTYEFMGAVFVNADQETLDNNNADNGVTVRSIAQNSRLVGVLESGDLIVSINRVQIRNINDLKKFAESARNQRSFSFKIISDGYMYIRSLQL